MKTGQSKINHQNLMWEHGRPCYCDSISPCDFCSGLASLTGVRAQERLAEQIAIIEKSCGMGLPKELLMCEFRLSQAIAESF